MSARRIFSPAGCSWYIYSSAGPFEGEPLIVCDTAVVLYKDWWLYVPRSSGLVIPTRVVLVMDACFWFRR